MICTIVLFISVKLYGFGGSNLTKMVVFHKNDHWLIPTDHHANFEILGIVEVTTLV